MTSVRAFFASAWLRAAVHGARAKVYEAGRKAVSMVVRRDADAPADSHHGPVTRCDMWNIVLEDLLRIECDEAVRKWTRN